MLDCAIIYLLLIIEHKGDVSPEKNTTMFSTAFKCALFMYSWIHKF